MCVCISLSAYVTLFCLFSPKISIILLHPDKNVRKLTMNSATYKRPFKPISPLASVDGRQNITTGTYGAHTDGGSGGPMSTTSQVLNLGESSNQRNKPDHQTASVNTEEDPGGCSALSCCGIKCQYTGPRQCGPTCCWAALKRSIAQCCSVGELGSATAMAIELDSYESPNIATAPRPSTSGSATTVPATNNS